MLLNVSPLNSSQLNNVSGDITYPPTFTPKKEVSISIIECLLIPVGGSLLPEIIIPISSISGSLNNEGGGSVLVVCPAGNDFASEISARADGTFKLITTEKYTDGTSAVITSDNYTVDSIQSAHGNINWSVSLRGGFTYTPPLIAKEYDAIGVSIENINVDGNKRIKMNYNPDILPFDSLKLLSGETIIVGVITYTISVGSIFMTITQA